MENTRRLLTRNTRDGKLGGVAAGVGDYLGVDPVLVRLAFVLLLFVGGAGLIVYLAAWVFIPAGDGSASPAVDGAAAATRHGERDTRWWIGAVLVAFGAVLLAGLARPWWLDTDVLLEAEIIWPLLLVAAGGVLLFWRRDDRGGDAAPRDEPPTPDAGSTDAADDADEAPTLADGAAATSTQAPSPESADEEAGGEPTQVSAAAFAAGSTAEYPAVEEPDHPDAPGAFDPDYASPLLVTEPLREPPVRRRRLPIGWITLGVILVSAAVAALLDLTGALDVPVEWFLVYALGLSGVGIVAAAWYGRIRGPATLAVLLGLALMVVAVVEVPLRGGVGERTIRPASAGELASEYRLGVGRLVLDLRQLSLAEPLGRIEAGVGVGELVVLLPPGAVAQVAGRASVGEVQLFDRGRGGIHVVESYPGAASPDAPAPLTLDLEVGVGRVETQTAPAPPPGSSL